LQYAVQIAKTWLSKSSTKLTPGVRLLPIGLVTHEVAEEKGPNGMPELGSPSVRRRRLAAELRRLREEADLTGEDVAESLGWSASKLSRIELARTGIKPDDLSNLLTRYGVPEDHRAELLRLVQKPRTRGWWQIYTDSLPENFVTLIGLESEAESISAWSPELVPGLLQTQDYARAAIDAHVAATASISPSEIERWVQTRLKRQRILTSDPPTPLVAVLDESVLLRRLNSQRVMRDQLAHLIEVSRWENVTLRVLPLGGAHPIGTGAFILLRFAPIPEIGPVSDIVYLEQLGGGAIYVDDDSETHQYELGFGHLVAESLGPAEARHLIAQVMRDRWST
jgi:transcriptional regulator with XRE-family HTH domain